MAKKLTGEGVQHEGRFWTIVRRALVILMLTLASCGGSDTSDTPDSSLACDHFYNVSNDAANGLLTNKEIRSKLQEVHSNASIATPAVRAAAKEMLAAATAGNTNRLSSATTRMMQACESAGA